MRKLPIGIQGFEKMRTENYLYVDKTQFIYDIARQGGQFFLSRPRRFGKSLLLSSLRAYYEGKRELFRGLRIEELTKDDPEAWQAYPVFYFDFNGMNYQADTALEDVLDSHLRGWEQIYSDRYRDCSLEERFKQLLIMAREQTGRRCVVLVDEYDKPLLEVLEQDVREEHNRAVFKGFFSTLKSYDDYLQLVFITGVTKFSKVSIFSDLNQLNDISFNRAYAGICGMTRKELAETFQPELRELSIQQGMTDEEVLDTLQRRYDGYHFHYDSEGLYNPFSLLKCLFEKEFGSYWFETGTPTFLARKLRQTGFDVRSFTNRTLYSNETVLSNYKTDNSDLVPLLYQTGYLTIIDYDKRRRRYTLGFPNEEVEYGFLEGLAGEYLPAAEASDGTDIFAIDEYLERGDLDGLHGALIALFARIPYTIHDTPFEHYFQTVLYLVFTLLKQFVRCEMHTFKGRVDCVVETKEYVYIFEFKRDDSADRALEQIEEMGYALPYAADRRKLYKIGVSFDSESRMLTEWKVEEK